MSPNPTSERQPIERSRRGHAIAAVAAALALSALALALAASNASAHSRASASRAHHGHAAARSKCAAIQRKAKKAHSRRARRRLSAAYRRCLRRKVQAIVADHRLEGTLKATAVTRVPVEIDNLFCADGRWTSAATVDEHGQERSGYGEGHGWRVTKVRPLEGSGFIATIRAKESGTGWRTSELARRSNGHYAYRTDNLGGTGWGRVTISGAAADCGTSG